MLDPSRAPYYTETREGLPYTYWGVSQVSRTQDLARAESVAATLYRRANEAAADAIRFRRDPHGGPIADVRARDARHLRVLAREALKL